MRQAEKALRDAGWEEINLRETRQGDEVYDLDEHDTYVINCPALPTWEGRVLRAPRPEPEYEPGTVVWADTSDGKQSLIAVGLPGAMCWIGKATNGLAAVYPQGEVEVLRVLVCPDGSTHRPGDSFGQCVTGVDAASERADARARELLERLWEKLDGKDDTK